MAFLRLPPLQDPGGTAGSCNKVLCYGEMKVTGGSHH